MPISYSFFSSRRRHTRWNCDWSSDVCSSDLDKTGPGPDRSEAEVNGSFLPEPAGGRRDPPQAVFLSSPPRPKKPEKSPCACARERDGPASRRGRRFSENRRERDPAANEDKSSFQLSGTRRRAIVFFKPLKPLKPLNPLLL